MCDMQEWKKASGENKATQEAKKAITQEIIHRLNVVLFTGLAQTLKTPGNTRSHTGAGSTHCVQHVRETHLQSAVQSSTLLQYCMSLH